MNRDPNLDPEAAFALELAVMCKATRQLPGPGGVLDQDHVHMKWLMGGLAAIAEKEKRDIAASRSKRR